MGRTHQFKGGRAMAGETHTRKQGREKKLGSLKGLASTPPHPLEPLSSYVFAVDIGQYSKIDGTMV